MREKNHHHLHLGYHNQSFLRMTPGDTSSTWAHWGQPACPVRLMGVLWTPVVGVELEEPEVLPLSCKCHTT